jgi:putative Mg2+ transporter-C (MgtC) family protein
MGLGTALWQEVAASLPDNVEIARIVVRLLVAGVLGGILGLQRAHVGKAAGVRTHMLVSLGAAIVVLLPHLMEMSSADMSRIIQVILTGIGFIGGGVILKMSEHHQIVGITTAASIWLAAILGIVTGTGRLGLAIVGAILAFIILSFFGWLEHKMFGGHEPTETPSNGAKN